MSEPVLKLRCISCGTPIAGLAQLCEACAAREQQRSIFLPGQVVPVPDELQLTDHEQTSLNRCRACGEFVETGAPYCQACGSAIVPGLSRPAGFWIRLAAAVIDGMIVGSFQLVIALLVSNTTFLVGILLLMAFAYTVGFWLADGATPGKMALHLKVVMADGSPVTPRAAVGRFLGYALAAGPLLLGYALIGVTWDKRGLHDYVAGTVVVRER
jgi:uncharacterized RDD family membrane protein YckC